MPTLEAGSVDAIITDLPYGTTACEWDSIIPLAPMWEQVKRILKPSGVFITTASMPFTGALWASNPQYFKYDWVWNKYGTTNFGNVKIQPLRQHESVLVFYDTQCTYNPQVSKDNLRTIFKGRYTRTGESEVAYNSKSNLEAVKHNVGYPKTILEYMRPNNRIDEGGLHPTQKPTALYRYLIRTYTNHNEVVLDFCFGSGTTIISAIAEGRRSIGIERDPKYFAIAEKRISQAAQQPALFHATQQSVQRTGGESGQQSLFSAGDSLPAKVTRQSTRR